jgi:small subunit ribosomal protein S4
MSRYTGPAWKVSRRLGFSTLETGEEFNKPNSRKRAYAPGQHGPTKKRKMSEYGRQLAEKQKLRFTYGISERQFRRFFMIAKQDKHVVTGLRLIYLLESRLDNVVFRMALSRTRRGARQLVAHGHILVNGQKVNIPSYICDVKDVISLQDDAKGFAPVKDAQQATVTLLPFVSFNAEKGSGVFERLPNRSEILPEIDENLVVDYYNRFI